MQGSVSESTYDLSAPEEPLTEAENSFDSYFDRNENPEMDFPFYFEKSEFK